MTTKKVAKPAQFSAKLVPPPIRIPMGLQDKAHASETYKQLVSSLELGSSLIYIQSHKASGTATPILSKSFDKQLHKLSTQI